MFFFFIIVFVVVVLEWFLRKERERERKIYTNDDKFHRQWFMHDCGYCKWCEQFLRLYRSTIWFIWPICRRMTICRSFDFVCIFFRISSSSTSHSSTSYGLWNDIGAFVHWFEYWIGMRNGICQNQIIEKKYILIKMMLNCYIWIYIGSSSLLALCIQEQNYSRFISRPN